MEKREFGKLNARFLGKFMGLDLYTISTLPVYIDDCPVNINFAVNDDNEGDSAPALNKDAFEQALMATCDLGSIPEEAETPAPMHTNPTPKLPRKSSAPAIDFKEFHQMLKEGEAAFEKLKDSVDL